MFGFRDFSSLFHIKESDFSPRGTDLSFRTRDLFVKKATHLSDIEPTSASIFSFPIYFLAYPSLASCLPNTAPAEEVGDFHVTNPQGVWLLHPFTSHQFWTRLTIISLCGLHDYPFF